MVFDPRVGLALLVFANLAALHQNGIPYSCALADTHPAEHNRMLHLPVKNRTAADDGIRHIRAPVVFCRGLILRLCFNIGIFIDEMIANILFQEIHIRLKISRNACADGIPVAIIFIAVDFQPS